MTQELTWESRRCQVHKLSHNHNGNGDLSTITLQGHKNDNFCSSDRIAGENGLPCYFDFSMVGLCIRLCLPSILLVKAHKVVQGPIVLFIQCLPDLLCPSMAHRSLSEEVWMTLGRKWSGKGSL